MTNPLSKDIGRQENASAGDEVHIGVLVCEAAPPFAILSATDLFERLTGYSTANVAGGSIHTLFGPETDSAAVDLTEPLLRNGMGGVGEFLGYTASSAKIWLRAEIRPVTAVGAAQPSQFLVLIRTIP